MVERQNIKRDIYQAIRDGITYGQPALLSLDEQPVIGGETPCLCLGRFLNMYTNYNYNMNDQSSNIISALEDDLFRSLMPNISNALHNTVIQDRLEITKVTCEYSRFIIHGFVFVGEKKIKTFTGYIPFILSEYAYRKLPDWETILILY